MLASARSTLLVILLPAMAAHATMLRQSSTEVSPMIENKGRILQNGTCTCDENGAGNAKPTIRLVSPGGLFSTTTQRFNSRVDAFYDLTGTRVEIVPVDTYDALFSEMLSNAGNAIYDGFAFFPFSVGDVSEVGGLADLTEYVAASQEVAWTDILPFTRDTGAVYNGEVLSVPCDGDIQSLFYRKDLFEEFGLEPPRTWDEYTERAKFFDGMEVPAADGNGTVILSGACTERTKHCDILRNYHFLQVHSATAQSKGTSEGLLFESRTFKPTLGEGMAETLRHLENHVMYGDDNELDETDCQDITIKRMQEGKCAMANYWGDVFSRHLYQGSLIEGKLGVAPTPGVTKVLDHDTGKLVNCTRDICPFATNYPDIGLVNHAPFAAAGGWSAGVAGGLPKERESAMADFINFVCGKDESFKDVITNATRAALATGADPYRASHFNPEDWVAQGYPRDTTEQYLKTITEQFRSPNIVLDLRFPNNRELIIAMGDIIYEHLVESKTRTMTHEDRLAVAQRIEKDWQAIIAEYDQKSITGLPLSAQYQKSLNVYVPPVIENYTNQLSDGAIIGLVVGCSLLVGLISGTIIFVISRKRLREQQRHAAELAAKLERENERDEKEEILKLSRGKTRTVQIWRVVLLFCFVCTSLTGAILAYLVSERELDRLSSKSLVGIMGAEFCVVVVCFFFYDKAVRRRTEFIVANAARANAVVTSMFPAHFRDQIIEEKGNEVENRKHQRSKSDLTMKRLLDGGSRDSHMKPLADLFLETTVMFADIVGFTAWSSARSPEHVFTLLESVYARFDAIASRRGIFKVETVGDCYVAVAGLPEPHRDHALAIVRFANDIIVEMGSLTKHLEIALGPDTADLTLRVGIHSGPVTAGVLRGSRARFQLFGDTMNTASRIEQTGIPNRIHVSEQCANLIAASGKDYWLDKLDSKVLAKGKGYIQTYWVNVNSGPGSASGNSESDYIQSLGEDLDDREQRLISWNIDQLVPILKQVVARREGEMDAGISDILSPAIRQSIVPDGASLLDNVKEIIELPAYDDEVVSRQRNPEQVEIPQVVMDQMHRFVSCICQMYKANAFHNFEHASAVTMSVLKLLSRIVAPTEEPLKQHQEIDSVGPEQAATLHDHTYGITSDPLTQFACAFSALIHDADHPGVPNSQLAKEKAPMSMVFGDRSTAEQNSLVICWDLFMAEEFSDFRHTLCATQSELNRFRELVVNSVMATDIVDRDLKKLRNQRWDKAFAEEELLQEEPGRQAINRKATIVIEHLIQASDVAHTMQHWHIYRKWNERLFQENYAAYKSGRAATDPTINWYKGEMAFFDFYIIPLAKKLKDCGVFGKSSDEFLNYAQQNRAEWEDRGEQVISEMMDAVNSEAEASG